MADLYAQFGDWYQNPRQHGLKEGWELTKCNELEADSTERVVLGVLAEKNLRDALETGNVMKRGGVTGSKRWAATPATWRRLAEVPGHLDPDVRAVVLTGEGASFCAGLDRRMLSPEGVPGEESLVQLAQRPDSHIDGFITQAQAAFTWWRTVPQVTIALVQGHAIGAGFQLALACDVLVVADDAQLAMRETSLGLVPDLGGTGPLVERVGYARAFEICATGRFVGPDEAVMLGIQDHIELWDRLRWDQYLSATAPRYDQIAERAMGRPSGPPAVG